MVRENKLKLASRPVPWAARLTLIAGLFWVAKQVKQGVGCVCVCGRKSNSTKAVAFSGKLDKLRNRDRLVTELEAITVTTMGYVL